ncbi:hypothetical protein B0F90DRAFT_1737856 [Multifurca ochricompacta]|uniref:Peptidase C14 caspase domain-containing protein n=1 Tax=Multifurca ochricompacta TaxID=376703 RepID=A0AAD4M1E2_9AGAM|nr:hypothetical protein B0F90DRAFT_1737856 [Multifurca ochricompacta]
MIPPAGSYTFTSYFNLCHHGLSPSLRITSSSSMGALLSSLFSRCVSVWSHQTTNSTGTIRLPDLEEGKSQNPTPKRRALLVGISYWSGSDNWAQLEGTHGDVDNFRDLLIGTYGYLSEEITVLKDDPKLPVLSQPTRVNMIRELRRLVSNPASGDKFTFLCAPPSPFTHPILSDYLTLITDSGHSDQQISLDDSDDEEDGQDEVIITCDEGRIIDNELKEILVMPLPVGCSLLAILDTCHSGTMLDLPHHHCNSVYVPWQSKGNRRTGTLQCQTVRGCAMGLSNLSDLSSQAPSISSVMNDRLTNQSLPLPLRIDTQVGSVFPAVQRTMSMERYIREGRSARGSTPLLSPTRYESPVSRVKCDGWCGYEIRPHPNVLSLSACSDLQRAWEGPRGSLTAVLCNFLSKGNLPQIWPFLCCASWLTTVYQKHTLVHHTAR